ncbi:HEAT repeat-containing protein 4 [Physocladia obscura]|uniref:HEAT repeat-containing protein 4 n=1 Tax=Physocladia obscura TaxID=109957 RepID=A0AAD5T1M7_9FUNG|nr:HEAT repeat-containing protein 4 [Physocladia obscura]
MAIPPIPRPHRKALMSKKKRRKNGTSSDFGQSVRATPAHKSFFKVPKSTNNEDKLCININYVNPVAAAIDVPFVADTRIPFVHPPPRLPPCYAAHLRDLQYFKLALDDNESGVHEQSNQVVLDINCLSLKFERSVQDSFTSWPYHLGPHSNFYDKRDSELQTNQILSEKIEQKSAHPDDLNHGQQQKGTTMIHKSDWLRDVRNRVPASQRQVTGALDEKIGANMKGYERNVPYMLEVWQRVEGVNLNQLLHNSRDTEDIEQHGLRKTEIFTFPTESVHATKAIQADPNTNIIVEEDETETENAKQLPFKSYSAMPRNISPQSSVKSIIKKSNSNSRPISAKSSVFSTTSADSNPTGPPPQTPHLPPIQQTLSSSTIALLKKLAMDSKGGNNASAGNGNNGTDPQISPEEVNKALRLTLTGPEITAANDVILTTNSTSLGKRKDIVLRRRQKHTYRLKASGGFMLNAENTEGDFQLVVPIFDDADGGDEYEMARGSRNGRSRKVSVKNSGLKNGNLEEIFASQRYEALPADQRHNINALKKTPKNNEYNFMRLVTLINRYKTRESSFINYMYSNTPTAPIKIEDISDFLMTPYTLLEELPEHGTEAHTILYQTLLLCLLNQNGTDLRFEAAKILILLNDHLNLPRWEAIAFKNTLNDAIRTNSSLDDAFLAGVTLCKMGVVDSKTVRRVKHGLGDFDVQKRTVAVDCLANLDLRHATGIMDMLLSESTSTSWRVRMDVVELLRRWIQRIDPVQYTIADNEDEAVVDGSVDALDMMSRQANEKYQDIDYGDADSTDVLGAVVLVEEASPHSSTMKLLDSKSITHLQAGSTNTIVKNRLEGFVLRAIDVLLDIMWNDWSKDVRSLATKTLALLNQGKKSFDWIIEFLNQDDPGKKINALRCLSNMGVATGNAMNAFLKTFKDSYNSVRIEACKVACGIVTKRNRALVNALLDCLNDFDNRVRAYAIKAIGLSKCTEPRIRESLYWSLIHDKCASVRAEAIHATSALGLLEDDTNLRESIYILMDTDKDDGVQKESERALVESGFMVDSERHKIGKETSSTATNVTHVQKRRDTKNAAGEEYNDNDDGDSPQKEKNEKDFDCETNHNTSTIAAVPGGLIIGSIASAATTGFLKTPSQKFKKDSTTTIPKPLSEKNNHFVATATTTTNNTRQFSATAIPTTTTTTKTRLPRSIVPAAVRGSSQEEIELYFRESLVGDAEQKAVIAQVKGMSLPATVLSEVALLEKESTSLSMDLGLDLDFRRPEKFNFAKMRGRQRLGAKI